MYLSKIVTTLIIKWQRRLQYIIHDVYCDVTYLEYLHVRNDITKTLRP
jgi:DNA recombination-dependent growth factor C